VDSSATAALLQEQGYEVIGITLKLWPQDCVNRAEDKCCGPQAVTDARAVCHKLQSIDSLLRFFPGWFSSPLKNLLL
jgi:tRNA U34 2-thiouridine synthase MnmA/TrmU